MKIWEELSEDDFHKNVVIKQKKWQTLQSINHFEFSTVSRT